MNPHQAVRPGGLGGKEYSIPNPNRTPGMFESAQRVCHRPAPGKEYIGIYPDGLSPSH